MISLRLDGTRRRIGIALAKWIVASAVGASLGACAESPRPVPPAAPLGAMLSEHGSPFTSIRMVELRDGRVLAYDGREKRLSLIDFEARHETLVSRNGPGPLEYSSGLALVAARSDSVWMLDLMRGTILVFSPTGRPVRSFDITGGAGRTGRASAPWLRAVDSAGAWYGAVLASRAGLGDGGFTDSVAVVRVRGAAAERDTLAMLTAKGARSRLPDGQPRLADFDPHDAFGVLRDGTVILVRGASYSPEIIDAAGGRRRGAPIAHQRVRLTVDEARRIADSTSHLMRGLLTMSLARLPLRSGTVPPEPRYAIPDPLPEIWPVLMSDELPVDARDRVWVAVRDSLLASAGQRYDLLDRDGRWSRAVRIPLGLELVGFGRSVVFVARRDADGLLWLRRYPLPE